ncbi:MAG: aminopeptidase P family protein [Aliishimia sp.]
MYQSFEVTARPEQGPARLAALREVLRAEGFDGFIIPRADAHQGEYVAPRDDRLSWVSGFTGSAGFCIALLDDAGVFIDGRYRTQVKTQVDLGHFAPVPWPETQPGPWLRTQLPDGGRVAYDPWLYTAGQLAALQAALDSSGIELVKSDNLVDRIWDDQPAPPMGPAKAHPIEFAGQAYQDKCRSLAQDLKAATLSAAVITLPDSICWLLNLRGADVPRNPVLHGFAILHADATVDLFVPANKLTEVADHLGDTVRVHEPDTFLDVVSALEGRVLLDKLTIPVAVQDCLGEQAVLGSDPCALPKARKNSAEIEGSAAAHLRDGAAVVELLAWLDAQAPGTLRETDVVTRLETARRQDNALRDISFETISGTGPNGAIMHYRVTEDTDSTLEDGHLLVLDSGGQYLDGTTDITRTIAIGSPPEEARQCFTRVLQGMIGMSRLRWPLGLAGRDIEMIGRLPLWMAGQDFDHGLGHGVGAYLSVHEGPQRLSRASTVPLEPGMILSNEPGYYREGAFGIRIENLLVVQDAPGLPGGDDHRKMLKWRNLTFAPIDRRLIVLNMLTDAERAWINAYHAQVLELISPRVSGDTATWLDSACAAL